MARRNRRHVDDFGGNSEGIVSSSSGCTTRMVRERDEASSVGLGSTMSSGVGVASGSCFGSDSGLGSGETGWIPVAPGHEPLIM